MVSLNKVRRLFAVMQELGLYTEPLLNVGYDDEIIAEFWCGEKYLCVDIYDDSLDIRGMQNGVHTVNSIEKGWLYEAP